MDPSTDKYQIQSMENHLIKFSIQSIDTKKTKIHPTHLTRLSDIKVKMNGRIELKM